MKVKEVSGGAGDGRAFFLSGFLGMSEQNATASRIEEYARRWFIRVTKWCSECRVR